MGFKQQYNKVKTLKLLTAVHYIITADSRVCCVFDVIKPVQSSNNAVKTTKVKLKYFVFVLF